MTVESNRRDAAERFREAAKILRGDDSDLRRRLTVAFVSQLWEIDPARDLPQHLQQPFKELLVLLTQDEVIGDKGTIAKELEKLTDDQVQEIERDILDMERMLSQSS